MTTVTGAGTIEIAGESRAILFDIDAADALFDAVGEHWVLWLMERFLPRALPGRKDAHIPALAPRDLLIAAHAVCAVDRFERKYAETLEEFRRKVKPFELGGIQPAITRAVLASFGAPGEGLEVAASVDGASPSSGHAPMHGAGTRS